MDDNRKASYSVNQSQDPLTSGKGDSLKTQNQILKIVVVVCVILIVALVVAVCLLAIRPWYDGNSDKTYEINVVDDSGSVHHSSIKVNIDLGEEVYYYYNTSGGAFAKHVQNDAEEDNSFYWVRDVNKKLDASVSDVEGLCFLSEYDANEEVSPVELDDYLSSYSNEDDEPFMDELTIYDMGVYETPIDDVSAASSIIGSYCSDKTSYWTVTVNTTTTCGGSPCEEDVGYMDPSEILFHGALENSVEALLPKLCRVCEPVTSKVCKKVFKRPRWRTTCKVTTKLLCKWVVC